MVVTKGKRTVSLVLGSLFFVTSMINSYAMPNINENVTNDISMLGKSGMTMRK